MTPYEIVRAAGPFDVDFEATKEKWKGVVDVDRWEKDHPGKELKVVLYQLVGMLGLERRLFESVQDFEAFVMAPETLTCPCYVCRSLARVRRSQEQEAT